MKAIILLAAGAAAHTPVITPEFVAQLNAQPGTWTASLNTKFFNMSLEEAKRLMGARRDPARRAALPVRSDVSAVPTNFNASSNWPACTSVIGHIRDQSDCGCCWAFGSSTAFNDRICIKTNSTTLLSPQDTCSCCDSAHGCSSGGCDGGYTEDAFNYFMAHGLVTGGDWGDKGKGDSCFPYQLETCGHHEASPLKPCPSVCSPGECATPKCPTACSEKTYNKAWAADKHKAKAGAYRLSSVAAAQTDIMKYGSIAASFTVYADFLTYTDGVYTHKSGAELGGHAVKVYGWGTTADGTDYWLVANSWNNYWGKNGSFMIARGTDECGFEDDLVAGTA